MTPDDFYILMDVLDKSGMDYMDMMEYLIDLEAWVDVYPISDENDISRDRGTNELLRHHKQI